MNAGRHAVANGTIGNGIQGDTACAKNDVVTQADIFANDTSRAQKRALTDTASPQQGDIGAGPAEGAHMGIAPDDAACLDQRSIINPGLGMQRTESGNIDPFPDAHTMTHMGTGMDRVEKAPTLLRNAYLVALARLVITNRNDPGMASDEVGVVQALCPTYNTGGSDGLSWRFDIIKKSGLLAM